MVLNHFAEGSQIQTYKFLHSRTKKFYHKTIDTFCFIVLMKFVTQNLAVLLKDIAHRKGSFPSKDSDTKLLQSIYFT